MLENVKRFTGHEGCFKAQHPSLMDPVLTMSCQIYGRERAERTERAGVFEPTCDVDIHDSSAGPDAVGGVTHIGSSKIIVHRLLEEQGVVFDLHSPG